MGFLQPAATKSRVPLDRSVCTTPESPANRKRGRSHNHRVRDVVVLACVVASLLGGVIAADTGSEVEANETDISSPVHVANSQRQLREGLQTDASANETHAFARRKLAGGASEEVGASGGFCHQTSSFLGVGNTKCLHENIGTAIFLLGIIVVVSICFDRLIHYARHAIHCPQLSKIVNRIFQEVMIMGFISMVIFTLNTSGAMKDMDFSVDQLSASEQLHFYEFFHYIVFLTMIYFILIVLLLLFIGTVVPKLIWTKQDARDLENESRASQDEYGDRYDIEDGDGGDFDRTCNASEDRCTRGEFFSASRLHPNRTSTLRRMKSGMDLVQGSRAYSLLLERYQREGWCFRFNLQKQWHLWKSFEILAYNICQNRSGYIYKNPTEMERLFGVKAQPSSPSGFFSEEHVVERMTYARYHVLCMRNLLFHITDLHYSALFILVVLAVLPSVYPMHDHWIFIGVGGILLLVNLVIFFKVLKILRGSVDDRLRVITNRDIQMRLTKLQSDDSSQPEGIEPTWTPRRRLTLKAVALAVRAVIRMQMSALCHRQLHHHDDRFWFKSPKFLLRLFQFATIGQAFYLVWLSLVEAPTIMQTDEGVYLLPIMVLLPLVALCVITPMTMPSLVLVMSLTGIFVDLNTESSKHGRGEPYQVAQTRIRLMRRSFLKSHHNDTDDVVLCPGSPTHDEHQDTVSSPSNVFLRIYDSPTAAVAHSKIGTDLISPTSLVPPRSAAADCGDTNALLQTRRSSSSGGSSLGRRNRDDNGYSGPRRSFNLAAFQSSATPSSILTSLYESPRDSPESQTALPNWSQAKAERINSANKPAGVSRTVDEPNNQVDPTPSPASESLKRHCSKYGGYPES